MGERKVLNKYIPSDFDPSLVPRGKKLSAKDGTVPVRMMLPFSVQCSTCNTFLYRGRKFNSKKEPMGGPNGRYLDIQRWRFIIKCTHCARTITFCTDPKNADYEMESGGTRNYDVHKDKVKADEEGALEKEEEEKIDPMKALENRVLDSQREMADLDNLEEIKAMNRRHVGLITGSGKGFDSDAKALLDNIEAKNGAQAKGRDQEDGLTAEDEALVKSIKFGQQQTLGQIRRLDEEDERRLEEQREKEIALLELRQKELAKRAAVAAEKKKSLPVIIVKRKRAAPEPSAKKPKVAANNNNPPLKQVAQNNGGLAGLLGDYGSDSDSD